jgi:hypothetical protein
MTVKIQFLITNVFLGSEAAPALAVEAWTCCWVFAGVDKSLHRPGRIALWTNGNSVKGFD